MKRYIHYTSLGVVFLFLLFNIYKRLDYPKINSTACLDKYSREEMIFFLEVGFLFQEKACKWENDILVSVKGEPFKEDEMVIDSIVQELKPLIYPVKISRTPGVGNLVINFTNDAIDRQVMGFTDTKKLSFMGVISEVEMEIFSKVKGQARQACIRHEFLHALGLEHPVRRNTGTLIESLVEYLDDLEQVKLYRYSALDKSSLKILYSDCLPAGLKKKTFRKALNKHQAEINPNGSK